MPIRAKQSKPPASTEKPVPTLNVKKAEGETEAFAIARGFLGPDFRHGMAVAQLHRTNLGRLDYSPSAVGYADAITDIGDKAAKGDLAFSSRMLAAQAMTLDNIFAEMTRRMAFNMVDNLPATETYARIALKAQANSRATMEALTKLHQPREQTVRHVHVNEGGQAVIADQFHHHTGGQANEQPAEQPHAQGSCSPALPSPDPLRNGVPIPSRKRVRAVQDARRQG